MFRRVLLDSMHSIHSGYHIPLRQRLLNFRYLRTLAVRILGIESEDFCRWCTTLRITDLSTLSVVRNSNLFPSSDDRGRHLLCWVSLKELTLVTYVSWTLSGVRNSKYFGRRTKSRNPVILNILGDIYPRWRVCLLSYRNILEVRYSFGNLWLISI
jgi:hypothetical protein